MSDRDEARFDEHDGGLPRVALEMKLVSQAPYIVTHLIRADGAPGAIGERDDALQNAQIVTAE